VLEIEAGASVSKFVETACCNVSEGAIKAEVSSGTQNHHHTPTPTPSEQHSSRLVNLVQSGNIILRGKRNSGWIAMHPVESLQISCPLRRYQANAGDNKMPPGDGFT
jgi:hypothetical protein